MASRPVAGNRASKIKVDAVLERTESLDLIDDRLGIARRDVARDEVANAGILAASSPR